MQSMLENRKEIIHYPNLNTLLMVEEFIKKSKREYSKKQLWLTLPKRMMYQTFCIIIDYLLRSRKIIIDNNGKIIWIFADNEKLRNLVNNSVRV